MGELVRVYHGLPVADAQKVVDALAEIRIPAVWSDGTVKRVLTPNLKLPDQILLLIATSPPSVTSKQLIEWTEAPNKKYFMTILRGFHKSRYIEFNERADKLHILHPGTLYVQELVRSNNLTNII